VQREVNIRQSGPISVGVLTFPRGWPSDNRRNRFGEQRHPGVRMLAHGASRWSVSAPPQPQMRGTKIKMVSINWPIASWRISAQVAGWCCDCDNGRMCPLLTLNRHPFHTAQCWRYAKYKQGQRLKFNKPLPINVLQALPGRCLMNED
jgi:hypothetical protein